MKRLLLAAGALALILAVPALAAERTPIDLFGGYSLMHITSGNVRLGSIDASGFDTAVTYGLPHNFGATMDISAQYHDQLPGSGFVPWGRGKGQGGWMHRDYDNVHGSMYSFLFGPTYTLRRPGKKLQPMAHLLMGVSHGAVDNAPSQDTFTTALGGGVDVKLAKYLSVRPAQLDWVRTRFAGDAQDHLRYATGLVGNF